MIYKISKYLSFLYVFLFCVSPLIAKAYFNINGTERSELPLPGYLEKIAPYINEKIYKVSSTKIKVIRLSYEDARVVIFKNQGNEAAEVEIFLLHSSYRSKVKESIKFVIEPKQNIQKSVAYDEYIDDDIKINGEKLVFENLYSSKIGSLSNVDIEFNQVISLKSFFPIQPSILTDFKSIIVDVDYFKNNVDWQKVLLEYAALGGNLIIYHPSNNFSELTHIAIPLMNCPLMKEKHCNLGSGTISLTNNFDKGHARSLIQHDDATYTNKDFESFEGILKINSDANFKISIRKNVSFLSLLLLAVLVLFVPITWYKYVHKESRPLYFTLLVIGTSFAISVFMLFWDSLSKGKQVLGQFSEITLLDQQNNKELNAGLAKVYLNNSGVTFLESYHELLKVNENILRDNSNFKNNGIETYGALKAREMHNISYTQVYDARGKIILKNGKIENQYLRPLKKVYYQVDGQWFETGFIGIGDLGEGKKISGLPNNLVNVSNDALSIMTNFSFVALGDNNSIEKKFFKEGIKPHSTGSHIIIGNFL